jgi:hypothetical protein
MKKYLLILMFGFLAGTTLMGLLSPGMISWYFDPPTAIGVSCKEAVVWGINAYQKLLLVGGALGFFATGVITAVIAVKSKSPGTVQIEKPKS